MTTVSDDVGFVGRMAAAIVAANALSATTWWLIFLAIARLDSLKTAGEYSIIVAVATPIFFLFVSGIRPARLSDAGADLESHEDWLARVLGGSMAVVACAAWFILGPMGTVGVALAVGAISAKFVDAGAEAPYTVYQKTGSARPLLISTTARSIVLFAAVLVSLTVFEGDAGTGLLIGAGLSLVILLVFDAPRALRRRSTTLHTTMSRALAIVGGGLPLGVAAVLVSLTLNVPRIALGTSLGDAAAGRFAAMTFLFAGISLVTTAASHTSIPIMARTLGREDGRSHFLRTIRALLFLGGGLGAAAVTIAATIGPSLLGFLYGSSFTNERLAFVLMSVALAVSCIATFLQDGLTALGVHRMQVVIFGSGALVVLGCSIALIPRFGTDGAAIAVLAAISVQAALCAVTLALSVRRVFGTSDAPIDLARP